MSEWPPFPPPNPPQQPPLPPHPVQPPSWSPPAIPPPPVSPPGAAWGTTAPPGYPTAYSPYGTAPSATSHLPLANFGQRLGGYLIDVFVVTAILLPVIVALVAVGVATYESETDICTDVDTGAPYVCELPTGGTIMSWVVFGLVVMVLGLMVTYFVRVRPLSRTGQTIGRRALRIRVVREDTGALLSTGQALGREVFAYWISAQIVYLGYLWMLWDDRNQTWHDKVVSSIVVRAD